MAYFKKPLALSLTLVLMLVMGATLVFAADQEPGKKCHYALTPSGEETGTAFVKIKVDELKVEIKNAAPNTLYTVWIDHKNRATGKLAADYPAGGLPRGVAPAFATTDGVFDGMDLDLNGVITKKKGDKNFKIKLDYNLLQAGASPVVDEGLNMQGLNRVGGHWMRVYTLDENKQASLQVIDPETGRPVIERSTVQGITIVRHPDFITHGHTPGVGNVDHFSAFKGDFPAGCLAQ